MYSDFFDQIDAARNGRRGINGRGPEVAIIPETPPLVSFKAGKMKLLQVPNSISYQCEADPARGEVRLVWKPSDQKVEWQWYDRRNKKVVDKYYITEAGSTFERVDLSHSKKHKNDRIYLWSRSRGGVENDYEYEMYWMQDINDEKDDELVAQVNQYLADLNSAVPEGATLNATTTVGGVTTTNSGTGTTPAIIGRGTAAAGSTSSSSASQVDALSSILENLVMPQVSADGVAGGSVEVGSGTATGGITAGGTKQITLADLQGAMAGIQGSSATMEWSNQGATTPGPLLSELVTSDAVTSILESDDSAKQRLIALLPEGQQTPEYLAENLRSPQVQSTLRTLTQALLPDAENGDLSGYASVIANFNLDPVDGQNALTSGNPIQAFLDCIIKSVEKEVAEEKAESASSIMDNTNTDEVMTEKKDDDQEGKNPDEQDEKGGN